MRKLLAWVLVTVLLIPAATFGAEDSDGDLRGKWSLKKTNSEGETSSWQVEFMADRFVFEIRNADGDVRLYVKGKLKTEKAGPLTYFVLSGIQGGESESNLEDVDDDRVSVYTVRDDKLFLASNFDKERDSERPSVDVYSKVASSAKASAATGGAAPMDKLVGTWKMELEFEDNVVDYQLKIDQVDGKLDATLISPRSGKHKFKSVDYKDGELTMEIDREFEGRTVTLVYKGKLANSRLAGKVSAKGVEDRAGAWTAKK